MSDRLFTPRFFVMCSFTFTVFVSLFQLLPTAPYQVIALGGSTVVAGWFLGLLTYASAMTAPFTGNLGDRLGQRRVLMVVSLLLAGFSAAYAVIGDYRVMLALVVVHGGVWSALLTASGAYMTGTIPPARRAEGLGYWGLASVTAIAVAPPLGFWVYQFGWTVLCLETVALDLLMAFIAWRLPDDRAATAVLRAAEPAAAAARPQRLIEGRALILSVTLGLSSFSYGALTSFSALFADSLGISPRSLFLTAMAVAIIGTRLSLGRRIDVIGHRRALLPSLAIGAVGLLLLAGAGSVWGFGLAALVFGAGFGLLFPAFAAYLLSHASALRRGAAYGAMIAAFDTGIGTGSIAMGWMVERLGFRLAFVVAAVMVAAAIPYFLLVEKRFGYRADALTSTPSTP
jgi:MFS family permease